ncbi:PiggyBac transposable element-derived protein 4 [Plakobranchus ocellatus]|uniref:PiggyBac transposable element-derived protein 4 n=1 Tax=Plakobranchus ocellatus TaxID=259542 RepID=A0AAV4B2U0_9GAST|nr:PiggyBac transposable element-derived protein 4 [Plakobranchus ocellatus]
MTETNRMTDQFYSSNLQLGRRLIFQQWEAVDIPEMRKFIGTLLSGLDHKPIIQSYWTTDPLLSTPAFPAKCDRFKEIVKFNHFNDNNREPPHISNERDPLYKICPLLEQLSASFKAAFKPERKICIDDSLMLYKGRIIFHQYMPLKRAHFRIKIFA